MDLLPLTPPGPPAAITRSEAADRLRGRGLAAWWGRIRRGPLAETRLLQVPYRLFEVRIRNAGREQARWLAADAISGALDLYGFERPPAPGELARSAEGEPLPAAVPPARLAVVVEECVRRQVYARGFFQLRGLCIEVEDAGRTLFVPYWVGIHRKGTSTTIEVLGGLRRGREGARLRDILRPWIAA